MANYIEVDGVPVEEPNIYIWSDWFKRADRVIGKTTVGSLRVSTVFLGTDHNFSGNGPPVLYETMVFGVGDDDDHMRRYCTRAEAIAGHLEVVAELSLRATAVAGDSVEPGPSDMRG